MSILIIYSPKNFDLECVEEFTKNFNDMKFVRGTPSELEIIIHYIRENVELWNEKEGHSYIDKERLALLKKLEGLK